MNPLNGHRTLSLVASAAIGLVLCASATAQQPGRSDRGFFQPIGPEQIRGAAPESVIWEGDIAYRPGHPLWKLDLARPRAAADKPRPAIVCVHGGGWATGDKRAPPFWRYPLHFAERGYVSVSINYRLSGEAPFPACVEDVKCAVRWLRANAAKYRIDPARIGGYGNSAGAHLVAMLGLVGKDAGLEGGGPYQEQSSLLNAVCASAVPTDFTNWANSNGEQQGPRGLLAGPSETYVERAKRASPVTYASAAAPPFLLIQGNADSTVPPEQAMRLARALRDAGAKNVACVIIDGGTHVAFTENARLLQPMVDAFFDGTVGAGALK